MAQTADNMAQASNQPLGASFIGGLGLALAWIYAPFLSGDLFYTFFHLGFGIALLVSAWRWYRLPGDSPNQIMPWIAAALMAMGSCPVFIPQSHSIWHCAFGALSGAGSAYLFSRWFLAYSAHGIKQAVNATLLAFAFSATARFILVIAYTALPPLVTCVALMVIPFASVWSLVNGRNYKEDLAIQGATAHSEQSSVKNLAQHAQDHAGLASLALVAAELVAYGLVFGVLRDAIGEWSSSTPSMVLGHALRIVLPLLLYWWLAARAKNEQRDGLLRAALLLIAFILLAAIFFGGAGQVALSAIVLVARSFVSILIYVRLFDLVKRTSLHPCVAYGIGRAVYEFSLVIGLIIYDQMLVRTTLEALPFNIVYFAIACIAMLLLSSFTATLKLSSLQEIAVGTGPSIEEACIAAIETWSLSEREAQVLPLVAKGHTKKYIADQLGLSEDTIRYHTKQLYRKLDVHSRQELLLRIGIT